MKRLKEISLICFGSYTLYALAGTLVMYLSASAYGTADGTEAIRAFASDVTDFSLILFLYSIINALSFLLFDIKWLPSIWKRTLHIAFNYVVMIALFLLLTAGRTGQGLMILVLSFVFVAVYYLGMLFCKLAKKLEVSLEEAKKTKKQ